VPIDLDHALEVFDASRDLTVGIEEEFALLDPRTHELIPRFEHLRDAAAAEDPHLHAHITGELISSEIEIVSGAGEDVHDALARQHDLRHRLFAHVARHEIALGATGTHPWADYREQPNIDTEHYRRVVDGLGYVARRNNTFAQHVHVGVRGGERAVRVADRLRPVLPLLLAVSANSPYVDGRFANLHTARTQTFTKSFPRCGVPDAYGSWDAYRAYLDLLIRTGSIVEYTQVWWSVRPHFAYGTVEVRVCDAQMTAGESDDLVRLVVACIAQAMRDEDEGRPLAAPPGRLIEENMWRAIRFGLDGEMLDLEAGAAYPAADIVPRLGAWTEPVRAELGFDLVNPAERGGNGAQRQWREHAAGADLRDVYAGTVQQTARSYSMEVPA
jgi:carboxylate-amine ligase